MPRVYLSETAMDDLVRFVDQIDSDDRVLGHPVRKWTPDSMVRYAVVYALDRWVSVLDMGLQEEIEGLRPRK